MKDTLTGPDSQAELDEEAIRKELMRATKSRDRMARERAVHLEKQSKITNTGMLATRQLSLKDSNTSLFIGNSHNFIKHVWYIEAKGKDVVVLPNGISGARSFKMPSALKGAYVATMDTPEQAQQLATDLKAYRHQQCPPPIIPSV